MSMFDYSWLSRVAQRFVSSWFHMTTRPIRATVHHFWKIPYVCGPRVQSGCGPIMRWFKWVGATRWSSVSHAGQHDCEFIPSRLNREHAPTNKQRRHATQIIHEIHANHVQSTQKRTPKYTHNYQRNVANRNWISSSVGVCIRLHNRRSLDIIHDP